MQWFICGRYGFNEYRLISGLQCRVDVTTHTSEAATEELCPEWSSDSRQVFTHGAAASLLLPVTKLHNFKNLEFNSQFGIFY